MAKPTSAQDSNSTEKTFKPNRNPFCPMRSDCLSLPTKLVGAGLDSILSHVRSRPQKLRYGFSNRETLAHNQKWLKISSRSSTSLVVAAWVRDSETTNSKYAKTVSYQVSPCQKLAVIRKEWMSDQRQVDNISIAYLEEHQGFTKIGNRGEKLRLKMVLKTSGLIPQWCIERTIAAFTTRIQDLALECHKQIASVVAPTYDFIFFPIFDIPQIVEKISRNLRNKAARAMMNLAGARCSKPLQHLCYLNGSKLVGIKEESTSKTFWSWGKLYLKLGDRQNFKYSECGYAIPSNCPVVRRIFWNSWWDTISIANPQARWCCT